MSINPLNIRLLVCLFLAFHFQASILGQQQADTSFVFNIENPRYSSVDSPMILIDGMHNNLHQLKSGFAPFAKLAMADGYNVDALESFSQLDSSDIFVIANAINEKNQGNWQRPIYPAFEESEIQTIKNWVEEGGNLLLIADHMPFAGAANDLALAFGFEFCDGFAQLSERKNNNEIFSKSNSRLVENVLNDGTIGNPIESLTTFTGSSFSIPEKAQGILKFSENDRCLQPEIAWQFNDSTHISDLKGKYQGAIMNYGKGKIAVFGEAAMFTAQTIVQNEKVFKVGFNSPAAPNNVEFVRNLLFWLSKDSISLNTESNMQIEILKVNEEMMKTFNAGKYSEVADFYTMDGVMLGNNAEVKGRENLREYWSRFSGAEEWKLSNIEIMEMGSEFALQRGMSSITYKNSKGQISESRVIFSLVWEKTNEGWKIKLDHYSPR